MADETMQFRWAGMAPQAAPNVGAPVPPQGAMLETDRQKLVQELQANEAKIAELKQKLSNARTDMDARDMRLAANRAGVGDIASSMAHQRNIEDRAYRTASEELTRIEREKAANADREYEKQKLIQAIEDLDILVPKNGENRDAVELKRSRLVKELRDKYGVDYEGSPKWNNAEGGNFFDKWTADEWQQFYEENTDENGVFKSEKVRKIYENFSPTNSEEAAKKKANLAKGTVDEVEAKKKAAAAAAKRKTVAAIDEAIKNYSAWNLKDGETKTYTAKNGLTVTVTRINGKKRYAIGEEFKER